MTISEKQQKRLGVELVISVRTYEIDFAGIVSNIVYIKWLEDLRLKFLDEHLPFDEQFQQGFAPILTGTEIEYKRPIKLFDKVIGRLWLSSLGKLKWVVEAEILCNHEVAAIATQKGAFVNLNSGRPVPIPRELHEKYLQIQQLDILATK